MSAIDDNAHHVDLSDGTHVEVLELVTVDAGKRSYRVTLTPPGARRRERILDAVRAAEMAFWAEVAQRFPEATTGDFPPDAGGRLDSALVTAVQTWVEINVDREGLLGPVGS